MPQSRQPGPVDASQETVLRESVLRLFAAGRNAAAVADALDRTREDINAVLDPVLAQAKRDIIALARTCKAHLGPAEKAPHAIQAELQTKHIGCATSPGYAHGIMAGPIGRAEMGRHCIVELRRFSTAPGQPTDWIVLAGWAFLAYEDREWAVQTWSRARGLPTSAAKRHWGGPNRPIKVVQFVELP